MTDTYAMPVTTVRTDKPDIFALSGKIVITDTARLDRQFQCTRPIRYNRPIRCSRPRPGNRQIERNPTRGRHIGNIALRATIVTNLLAAIVDTVASSATIGRNLLFATDATNETLVTHGKSPLIVRTGTDDLTDKIVIKRNGHTILTDSLRQRIPHNPNNR